MADDDATRARRTTQAAGAPAKKAAAKKTAAKKAAAAAGRAAPPVKKAATRKAPARKVTTAKAAPAKKAATSKKASPGERAGAILAPRPRKAPPMRLAAEQPLEEDWEAPPPEPAREDPHARIRSVLRAAAMEVEGRSGAAAARPAPPAPPASDEPVTRVLVAPVEEDRVEKEDWSPPDVLEEQDDPDEVTAVMAPSPPPPPPAPSPPPPPTPAPPPPETPARPSPATTFEPAPAPRPERRAGAGRSILAIVVSLVVPVIGAVAGFFLARRARRDGAALSGAARMVSVLALVGWLVGGGVVAWAALSDDGVDYSELKVGDCFDSSQSTEIRGIKLKPCDQPHNSEVFFVVTHPAGPDEAYPGKDALVQYAADNCLGQPLTNYLGIPLEQSQLKDFEIVPQESAWEDGRRVLVCGLDTGGQVDLVGSVKGTRR